MSVSNDNTISITKISLNQIQATDALPPSNTRRWVISRKAAVVSAVSGGLISLEDACKRYSLSIEEFQSWQKAIDQNGIDGLRVTQIQNYR